MGPIVQITSLPGGPKNDNAALKRNKNGAPPSPRHRQGGLAKFAFTLLKIKSNF